MAHDASSPSAARDAKKKRGNRSAKLKQSKLDVRREQWLSLGWEGGEGCGIPWSSGRSQLRVADPRIPAPSTPSPACRDPDEGRGSRGFQGGFSWR
ncbi:hypothetical protein OsI_07813 [Oryza sativa Indica Group]|uniref:Uncharacterized protein n=1 Tax=Oryza sativa subsp. indica TaxID=39946 RepID=B8AEM5_ORYSI|nr:hypothetical protein OsI_07813 [Oryza sativa Indica Group]